MAKQVKTLRLNDMVALESDVDSRLHQSSAAPVFDDTKDYPADYHVTYNGYLYRFTSAHAAGAWTGNDVVAENMTTPDAMLDLTSAGFLRVVSADGTILWMQNALSASRNEIAANFSASTAYAPPALVVYNGVLYRCSTAHPAGAWNATHFTAATVQDVLAIINQRAEDAYDLADTKVDKSGDTMTGTFRLKGVLKVDTGDITTYELDYYGIRIYVNGVAKQIYMPPSIPLADSGYMALVENLAPGFSTSATYYKDDLVKYNGTLYMCMATSHTGAWSATDFAVASVQGALARKLGHEGPWVNGYIDVLERNTGESVPYGVRIYRDKIVFGAFTNTVPRGFTPIRQFDLPATGGTLALKGDVPSPATLTPYMDSSSGYVGDHTAYAREDHVHPSDTSKQNALSAVQLANIGSVSDAVDFSPILMYAAGQAVVYNGAVYVFTASHGGAWTGTDVKKVNLLADKLDKSGGSVAKIEWVNSGQSNATLLITFANGKTLAFDYDGYSSDTVATREWIAAQDFIKSLTSYFTAGNLVQLTQDGGIEDSGKKPSDFQDALSSQQLANIAAVPDKLDKSGGTMTGPLEMGEQQLVFGDRYCIVQFGDGLAILDLDNAINTKIPFSPTGEGTLALTAGTGHTGNLAKLDANGNPTDSGWKAGDLARYSLSTKTITSGAVSLDDRAINSVDATSAASVVLNFPDGTSGKARDFMMVLDCGATPPTLAYGSYITIYAEDDDALVPEEGRNIYMFTETSTNRFFAARKLVDKVVEQNAASPDQLMDALASAGIDTSTISNPGQMAAALGLSESSATFGQILGKV